VGTLREDWIEVLFLVNLWESPDESKTACLHHFFIALAVRSGGAELKFSNVTSGVSSPLNAVAYGGSSHFASAGTNSIAPQFQDKGARPRQQQAIVGSGKSVRR
jgi:hypothetical protein